MLPVHQEREGVRPRRLLLHCDIGLRLRPPSDAVRPRGLPFAVQDDHQLGRLDAEFEKLYGAQVLRLVAEDLGELSALRNLQVDGRLDVFILLLPIGLNVPGLAVVKLMFRGEAEDSTEIRLLPARTKEDTRAVDGLRARIS